MSVRTLLVMIALVAACLAAWTIEPRETVLRRTHRELDLAIVGHGYFQLTDLDSGYCHYTRLGRFGIDANSQLMHFSGRPIEPAISIPQDFLSIRVSAVGGVYILQPDTIEEQKVGQLQLARFINEAGLAPVGGDCFAQTDASSAPVTGNPMQGGVGVLQQGWLEGGPSWRERWLNSFPLALTVLSAAALVSTWAIPRVQVRASPE